MTAPALPLLLALSASLAAPAPPPALAPGAAAALSAVLAPIAAAAPRAAPPVAPAPAAAPEISVDVKPNDPEVGLAMSLTLTVAGEEGADCALLELPPLDGARLSLVGGPSRQQMIREVNGRRSASITTTWVLELVPLRPGPLDVPPLRLLCRGREVASRPVRLAVAEGRLVDGIVQLSVQPRTHTVWEGQVVEVDVTASLLQEAFDLVPQGGPGRGLDLVLPWLEGVPGLHPQKHEPPACNAWAMAVNGGRSALAMCQSRDFSSGELRFLYRATLPLLATAPGRVTLPGSRFSARLVVESAVQRDPFDVFQVFGRRSVVPTRVLVTDALSPPVELLVRPTPEQGRPPSFTNAVGRFVFGGDAGPQQVAVGESVRLQLVLTAEGDRPTNLPYVQWPAFDELQRDFRIFGKDERQLGGRRILEFELSPRSVAVEGLPALSFSFFDPEREAYETATVGPFALDVRPGGEGGLTLLAKPDETLVDLETIREELPPPAAPGLPPWTPVAASVLLLAAVELRRAAVRREQSDPAGRARRTARRHLEQALASATGVREVAAAFSRFLAARLDGPAAGLTAEEAAARLSDGALAAELRHTVERWQAAYLAGAELPLETAREQARALAGKVEAAT